VAPRRRRDDRPQDPAGPRRATSSGRFPDLLSGLLIAGCALGGLGLAGCAGSEPPQTAPARTAPSEPLAPAPDAAPDASPPSGQASSPDSGRPAEEESPSGSDDAGDSSNLIVIDRGAGGSKPSLWEAAVAERKRRATAKKSVASVTNENLHEYQDAELTFAQPDDAKADAEETPGEGDADTAPAAGASEAKDAAAPTAAEPHGEQYWRDRVLDVRTRLRDAADTIDDLEDRIATLRRRFYAEDDPYVRDGEIKPAWDRALDRLSREHRAVDRLQTELADTLEEGRRDGALPGWLREGIELEPTFDEQAPRSHRDGDLKIYEPTEPDTIDPEDTTPPPDDAGTRPPSV
jgi:hypothetical protein